MRSMTEIPVAKAAFAPAGAVREPERYEAPASYEVPDTGGGWDNSGSGSF
jgi:hypothetical protein